MKVLFTNVEALASKYVFRLISKEKSIKVITHKGSMSQKELIKIIPQIDVVVLDGRTKITRAVINAGNNLKIIARTGAGLDNIDINAASEKRVYVTYAPESNAKSVAEHVIGMLLALSKNLLRADRETRKGNYQFRNEFLGVEISGKTLGILGLGAVGSRLASMAYNGFNMKILAYDPYVNHQYAKKHNVQLVNLSELLRKADFVSVNCPLTKETRGLINEEKLRLMKKSAYIINTSRGGIIDENALYYALSQRWIAGAGLDVFEGEPLLNPNNPLFKLENVILSPHTAGLTRESIKRIGKEVANCVKKVLQNERPPIKNIVNKNLIS
jgi:D-3-phosphoglycerate dehydrogenase